MSICATKTSFYLYAPGSAKREPMRRDAQTTSRDFKFVALTIANKTCKFFSDLCNSRIPAVFVLHRTHQFLAGAQALIANIELASVAIANKTCKVFCSKVCNLCILPIFVSNKKHHCLAGAQALIAKIELASIAIANRTCVFFLRSM